MVDHARAARMAKRIQQIIATAIEREVKDPRLEYITITDARLTGDLHDATVFYTVRGESVDAEPDHGSAERALAKATGQLRKIMGTQLGVRFTPTLSFALDTVPEASAHIEKLLAEARARDEKLREAAREAKPAGEADPYRKPAEVEAVADGDEELDW